MQYTYASRFLPRSQFETLKGDMKAFLRGDNKLNPCLVCRDDA